MRVALVCAGLAGAQPCAGTTHGFCVTRAELAGPEHARAHVHVGTRDPGREAAGLMLVQHFRSKGTPAVRLDEEASAACAHAETQHITLGEPAAQRPAAAADSLPNLGQATRQASRALTGIAEDASRLLCRVLPC